MNRNARENVLNIQECAGLTNDIFENGSRTLFASGTVISAVQIAKPVLVDINLAQIFGGIWNFFDGIGNYASAVSTATKLKTTKTEQSRTKKQAWIAMDIAMGTQLNALTVMTLMAQYASPLLGPVLTASFLPVAAIGFAAGTWASFARSLTELIFAAKKLDTTCLIEDKLERMQHNSCTDDDKERFKNQIIALYRCKKAKETNFDATETLKNKITDDFKKAGVLAQDKDLNELLAQPPTETDKKLVEYLMAKQERKVMEHAIATTRWGFAAIGMTLFALLPYFPDIPELAIAAVVLTCIAGAMKLFEVSRKISQAVDATSTATNEENEGVHATDIISTTLQREQQGTQLNVNHYLSKNDQQRFISQYKQGFFNPAEPKEFVEDKSIADDTVPRLDGQKHS